MAGAREAVFSAMVARRIRQMASQCMARANASMKHCRLLEGLLGSGRLNLHGVHKIALDAMKDAAHMGKTSDMLWGEIGKATDKLPREQRQRMRKELEGELGRLDGLLIKLDAAARKLMKEAHRQHDQEIVRAAGGEIDEKVFKSVFALLGELTGILGKWKKEFRAAAR